MPDKQRTKILERLLRSLNQIRIDNNSPCPSCRLKPEPISLGGLAALRDRHAENCELAEELSNAK